MEEEPSGIADLITLRNFVDEALSVDEKEGEVSIPLGHYPELNLDDPIEELLVFAARASTASGLDSDASSKYFLNILKSRARIELTGFSSMAVGEAGVWRFRLANPFSARWLYQNYVFESIQFELELHGYSAERVGDSALVGLGTSQGGGTRAAKVLASHTGGAPAEIHSPPFVTPTAQMYLRFRIPNP